MKLSNFKKIDLKNTKVQAYILLILIAIGGSYYWYSNIYQIKNQNLQKFKNDLVAKQNELNRIFAMKPRRKMLQENVHTMNMQLDSLRKQFPDQKEIPRLISEITRVAKETGIFTVTFIPQADSIREFHIENNYSMSAVGGYHELARFFSFLANFDLIINLSKVIIKTNPGIIAAIKDYEEHGGNVNSIVATFNLTTFSSKK